MRMLCALLIAFAIAAPSTSAAAEPPSAAQLEFFETRIRPVLVDQCYKCHNAAKTAEGGLALDDRAGLLKGGDEGVIVVPGKPAESRLLPILRFEVKGTRMPKGGGKFDDRVIADFEKWIATGAADPRDKPPTAAELDKATSWETVFEKRKKWWSFQPVKKSAVPDAIGKGSDHPIDRFVCAKLQEKGLEPGATADARTLVRRLYFALVGLPPTPDEIELWTARLGTSAGFDELVDHLLASPHFGERWARHWMDWLRYAESHGSEGDATIENAWMYRDYLIRALNADVPYDQLVREHIAGDLLEQPRVNTALGINESAIGPAHWRMVFHGYAPTDALEEKVRFIDDEINTFSKAFLGLTVSCARCHDHKFDPISQKDYYALFGILGSCRPGRAAIDTPEKLNANRAKLLALKPQIRSAVADSWLDATTHLREKLLAGDGPWKKADKPAFLLHPWFVMHKESVDAAHFGEGWQRRVAAWNGDRKLREEHVQRTYFRRWNLANPTDCSTWFRSGNGLSEKPYAAGEFSISPSGENAIAGIYPSGIYSHLVSAKNPARLLSGPVHLNDNYEVWLRIIGDGTASARYVVQDYPRDGTVYPTAKTPKEWLWQKFDATYWNGDEIHLELAAGKDAPLLVNNEARSWFGIREALIVKKGEPGPPPEPLEFLDPIFETAANAPPKSFNDLADCYVTAITNAVKAWQAGSATDAQALLIDACLRQGLLPEKLDGLAAAKPLIVEYRRLEEEIVVPTRVPGLEETVARNQPLLERGNHKKPGAEVPRRFLEAINATPYKTTQSGRRQLAEDVLRDTNPLTRRVIVNRLWHHLFGRGIVPTPDNFGKLGQEPTHPELLDYLATRFQEHNGSIKDTIRFIVSSKTWQAVSRPSAKAQQLDPDNQYLSHTFVRRLEAEAIRDTLLSVSGTMSPELFGGPVGGNAPRRSVYVGVRRNSLDPFLRAFDFPEPFSAVGRRDVTNVPAQSLTMMNDDTVASLAAAWASRTLADKKQTTDDERIRSMFLMAFARPAQDAEISRFKTYLVETKSSQTELAKQLADLRHQIDERQAAIREIVEPVRTRFEAEAKTKPKESEQKAFAPIARWDFKNGLQDLVGTAHGTAHDGARTESDTLVVGKKAHVITAPLKQTLKEKTLEAWVQLDTLDQRGGGVMTIQTLNGGVFDAIVFGEKDARQWVAGSDGFQRTQSLNAPPEHDALSRPIHVAVAYHADGRITAYRDGQPYGTSYKSGGPIEFKAGEAVIGFGIRHSGGGNAILSGRILRAQLYDRALTADEIRATSQSTKFTVSEAQVLAALSESDRAKVADNKKRIDAIEAQIAKLGPVSDFVDDKTLWTDMARALFTFKEFIYVK